MVIFTYINTIYIALENIKSEEIPIYLWKYYFIRPKLTIISQENISFINLCVIIVEDNIHLNLSLDLSF